jgi:hypothetical protein
MLRYIVGVDFNARTEIESRLAQLAAAAAKSRSYLDQLCTVIDIIGSLMESKAVGFSGIAHKWSPAEHENLYVYSNVGVMGAINVPGNGRAQTFDLGLVGSAHLDRSEIEETTDHEATFSHAMNARRKGGQYHDWN